MFCLTVVEYNAIVVSMYMILDSCRLDKVEPAFSNLSIPDKTCSLDAEMPLIPHMQPISFPSTPCLAVLGLVESLPKELARSKFCGILIAMQIWQLFPYV